MNDKNNKVEISKKEYERLIESEKILNALYGGGVDNWEWYGDSLEDLHSEC